MKAIHANKTLTLERITKALQCSALLVGDIRETHKQTCQDNLMLKILIRELNEDTIKINKGLAELWNRLNIFFGNQERHDEK